MTEMTSSTLRCHICHVLLADNESTIKKHISSRHLNYWPYDCSTCNEEDKVFKAATEGDIDAHIATSHSAKNSGYHAIKDQIKESALKSAIDECRRISILQISSADTTLVRDQNPALNRPTDCGENVRVAPDSKEILRKVFISLGDASIDTENISTEVKQENPETSHDAALVVIRPEMEQNHNSLRIDQTLRKDMQNLIDRPALNDCQATLLLDYDQTSVINQEVDPNVDLSRLVSINLYPSATSSNIMENKYEINRSGQIHGTIEEVQDSNVTRTGMTTGKTSDNGNTQLSEQNEIHTAVDPNASGKIRATATSMSIPAEISPLKRAKGSNKHLGSRASKSPIVPQEPPRKRLKIHRDFDTGHELAVERKRGRFSRDAGSKRFVDGEKRFKCKQCHYATNYSSQLTSHMRCHTGERPFKCKYCNYAAAHNSNLIAHERTHTGEKPFKCQLCKYTTARSDDLVRHIRSHTGEKPYKCQLCKYAAARSDDLVKHISSHTGVKPFKCQFCEYATVRSGDLTKHIRIHTGDKPYKCRFCEFATACVQNINSHMLSKHKDALNLDVANSKKNTARKMLK